MFSAILHCGEVLAYEARSFVPTPGDRVPCRRHGYCVVDEAGRRTAATSGASGLPRAQPRAQDELLEWLRERPVTTLHALKRQRFTLRMIAAAEREGLLSVDLDAGRVSMR
jgi:hypothetical protein